jgi:hypothetical protein
MSRFLLRCNEGLFYVVMEKGCQVLKKWVQIDSEGPYFFFYLKNKNLNLNFSTAIAFIFSQKTRKA